jgi:AcrR family transcriptional regulator
MIAAMVASCGEKTYAATTISDIVAGARISRTTFYREFDDKRACFDAALEHCIEAVRETAQGACSTAEPPAQAVRRATAAVLELLAAQPQVAHLLVGEAISCEPAVIDRYRQLLVPAVADLWHDDEAPPQPPRVDPWLAFGRAQLLVFDLVTAGEAARLPELLPEIVYLAVAPFAGHEAALAEARASEPLLEAGG